eukprot:1144141-Pelagomonas_calceolata.AAC.2
MAHNSTRRTRAWDPRGTAVKDHNAIVLRAESMDVKMQWLHRMQRASALGQMPAKKKVSAHVCAKECVRMGCRVGEGTESQAGTKMAGELA